MSEEVAPSHRDEDLRCVDCGGWPIDDGSVFVAVYFIRKGIRELGGMCELCWLKRLERRGQVVNATSTPCSQVEVPALGLYRAKRQPRRNC